ncbi:uracil-DNA glycosylase [Anthocerotibacter panamensis]|uniref:uracil-DNA glycosylase n=1 Tax=Anthocerotibacter panamensis TaxID=2857077 RepID=UPI001C402E41|nr:uracil-DNA glycosylase [Anthocerotibacter panamensis]
MADQIDLFGLMPPAEPAAIGPEGALRIPHDASVPIRPGTYPTLDPLVADCNVCQRCDLGKTRTHAVVERGSRTARIMVVGEGPGENEDKTGQPFVGKAGQLLDKILASVQLDSNQDIYICNVVKCRPPNNREPLPNEVAACLGYLQEQIRLVNPWIILVTGATAMRALLHEKRGITKIRGQWFPLDNSYAMPILHPAYLLRNASREVGSPKWLMWQDIQAVRDMYHRLEAGQPVDDLLQK